MNRKLIESQRLGESFTSIEHPSGLTILLCPMEGFSTSYAIFGTKYGSVDDCFKTAGEDDFAAVPAGIAHYLEHKLFESEDGDAFSRYAATGASANAYTSFDRTCYLFACSDNFRRSIEILLDFVTKPYFTPETVKKEQGIIGQEIKMYDDDPDWRVFFNLLGALYVNHPVRLDIAGTVDSIAQIDADLLYRCYNSFYNLNNMVLAVAGHFHPEDVLEAADAILKPAGDNGLERRQPEEPRQVGSERVEIHLPVATPLFQIGFKGIPRGGTENMKNQVLDEILIEVIAGESTPFYRKLYDEGLINATFSGEILAGDSYYCQIYSGESRDPYRVYDDLKKQIEAIKSNGIDETLFTCAKRAVYGRYVGMFSRVDAVVGLMVSTHFARSDMYGLLDLAANATCGQLTERLRESFDTACGAISVVSNQGVE